MDYQRTNQHTSNAHQDHWDEVHNQLLAVQKKSLAISDPQDADEKEADEAAKKVTSGESAGIHGTGGTINRKGEGSAEATPEFQAKLENSKGGGQPLDHSAQYEIGSKMGADLSGVKIHTGAAASQMSESINAKAFTHGQDIYFNNSHSPADKELLAHELVHTVQQGDNVRRKKADEDEKAVAAQVHTALVRDKLNGGPDQMMAIAALKTLNKDKEKIKETKSCYKKTYHSKLISDINKYAETRSATVMLELINESVASQQSVLKATPSLDDAGAIKQIAEDVKTSLDNNDGYKLVLTLLPVDRNRTLINAVIEAYNKVLNRKKIPFEESFLGNSKMETDIRNNEKLQTDHPDEYHYALFLLNGPLPDSPLEKEYVKTGSETTGSSSGEIQVPGGTASARYDIEYTRGANATRPGQKTNSGVSFSYTGGLSEETRWLQFVSREIIGYTKDNPDTGTWLNINLNGYTTSPEGKLLYHVDGNPYYESEVTLGGITDPNDIQKIGGLNRRSENNTTTFDRPVSLRDEPEYKKAVGDPPKYSRVISKVHLSTFLIRQFTPVLQVDTDYEWELFPGTDVSPSDKDISDKGLENLDKQPASLTQKQTVVSAIPSPMHDVLVEEWPMLTYIR